MNNSIPRRALPKSPRDFWRTTLILRALRRASQNPVQPYFLSSAQSALDGLDGMGLVGLGADFDRAAGAEGARSGEQGQGA